MITEDYPRRQRTTVVEDYPRRKKTTVTEDYVSFEIAKLLKEKGFDEPCYRYYDNKGDICGKYVNPDIPFNYSLVEYYLCPSQSMAMKWLREVHDIKIIIRPYVDGTYSYEILNGFWYVNFDSYEQACEAAIKYCLENIK